MNIQIAIRGAVYGFAVLVSVPVLAQGEGEPPERMSLREKVDWIIQELGSSDDGLTIRESIQITDQMLLHLAGRVQEGESGNDDSDETGEQQVTVKEKLHHIHSTWNRDCTVCTCHRPTFPPVVGNRTNQGGARKVI